jgi:hypothetical protein
MRRVLGILAAFALAGCSTSDDSSVTTADASLGALQPLGAPCNSSLPNPCAPAPSDCSINICSSGLCAQFIVDGGAACTAFDSAPPPINAICVTSADCDGGLCGYYALGGCTATGVCFPATAPSGTLPPPACGCNGEPDPYITTDFTGAPAASPSPCVDAGPEAGTDAAGLDASDGAPE